MPEAVNMSMRALAALERCAQALERSAVADEWRATAAEKTLDAEKRRAAAAERGNELLEELLAVQKKTVLAERAQGSALLNQTASLAATITSAAEPNWVDKFEVTCQVLGGLVALAALEGVRRGLWWAGEE
jgi:hypothetical protein